MRHLLTVVLMALASFGVTRAAPPPAGLAQRLSAATAARPFATPDAVRSLISGSRQGVRIERLLQDRWLMLFVGTTLVVYRLRRKHQLLYDAASTALGYPPRAPALPS